MSALLESVGMRALLDRSPRSTVVQAARDVLSRAREQPAHAPATATAWAAEIAERVARVEQRSLRTVINATGIVLHTNLGRAPLPAAALRAIKEVASGYSNLEYDLSAGVRGSRYVHCSALLRELTGAEDALVVNNCAAALVLALNTMCEGRDAVLSRGELVEIGGSFRVHEIMAKSGARLREVGATNRTHLADYARVIGEQTGTLLKVHRSNFALEGFVADTSVRELAPLAAAHGVSIMHDLGSGLLIALDDFGLRGEPTARAALDAGADVVVMSGDKLLGGPQAGLILGRRRYLAAMRENPLARSYRVDKLTLAALEATLALYRDPEEARREIPTLALLAAPLTELRLRAAECLAELQREGVTCEVTESESAVGAGAFPTTKLPSAAIVLHGDAERWAVQLRGGSPAVVGRVHEGRLLLDMRAIPSTLTRALVTAVLAARG